MLLLRGAAVQGGLVGTMVSSAPRQHGGGAPCRGARDGPGRRGAAHPSGWLGPPFCTVALGRTLLLAWLQPGKDAMTAGMLALLTLVGSCL